MKANFTSAFLLFSVLYLLTSVNLKADTTTVYFPTLGNCYLCKLRIEECVNKLDGIENVIWDYNTDITTVTYEETITDPFIIMDAIALVGHDTEWYPAPDSSYQTLVGTCCEYERTIDYTNVQVGYLSLMDLWVYPVSVDEPLLFRDLYIYPGAGTGVFQFALDDFPDISYCGLSVYSMSGAEVYKESLSGKLDNRIDLSSLQRGQYIIIISQNNKLIARSKIIKL